VPDQIKQRFVQVGNKYHFPDGARAFTDHGNRLTSPSVNTEVIKSLISIAQVRGWSDITIAGTERFKKEEWFAARLAGLEVRGYKATEFEQGRLIRALARGKRPPRTLQGPTRSPAHRDHAPNARQRRHVPTILRA
jgi:putative DNA primase/helicase